ncbi:hypothetical protein QYF36_014734 [Acer negundo]|nr:hypothetical protein QYF36_014734 [Acer negundo]
MTASNLEIKKIKSKLWQGAFWKSLAKRISDSSPGGHSKIVNKAKGQVEDLQSLEPCKHSMRIKATINASGNRTLSEDQTVGVKLTTRNEKKLQEVIMKEKRGKNPALMVIPMKVDQPIDKGPLRCPT